MAEETKPAVKATDSNVIAALSYLWLLSIVFYILKKDDEFVLFHSRQAMVVFAISVLGTITSFMFIGFFFWIASIVMMIVGGLKAYKGEKFRIPVVADLAEKITF